MTFVEPHSCWQDRMVGQRLQAEVEARRRSTGRLHPVQAELLNIVANHDGPIRDTALGHAFAKIPGYHNRQERDNWIKAAWQHLTVLIRTGRLQWSSKRKHVEVAPPERHQAYLARISQMTGSLPKPCL